jgi:hypothetical protein
MHDIRGVERANRRLALSCRNRLHTKAFCTSEWNLKMPEKNWTYEFLYLCVVNWNFRYPLIIYLQPSQHNIGMWESITQPAHGKVVYITCWHHIIIASHMVSIGDGVLLLTCWVPSHWNIKVGLYCTLALHHMLVGQGSITTPSHLNL